MTKTIKVNGMKCEKCAGAVHDAISKMHHVKDVKVNLETHDVEIESDKVITTSKLEKVIAKLGFSIE